MDGLKITTVRIIVFLIFVFFSLDNENVSILFVVKQTQTIIEIVLIKKNTRIQETVYKQKFQTFFISSYILLKKIVIKTHCLLLT